MKPVTWLSAHTLPGLESPLDTVGYLNGLPKRVIIGLHGFGDTARNFIFLHKELGLTDTLWLCPEGPTSVMPGAPTSTGAQWFPLFSDPHSAIAHSKQLVQELINHVHQGLSIPRTSIDLLGFSQGAAMALVCGLTDPQGVGSIVSLSGFLLNYQSLQSSLSKQREQQRVFLGHGLLDRVVLPFSFFEAQDMLKAHASIALTAKTYQAEHTITAEECTDIKNFLTVKSPEFKKPLHEAIHDN